MSALLVSHTSKLICTTNNDYIASKLTLSNLKLSRIKVHMYNIYMHV